jgi:restriction system protein
MGVPDFQSLMLPLLQIAADGKEHSLIEVRRILASEFSLTAAELEETLPSGRQSKFANRVAWGKVYLQQAGLLLSSRRAHFHISPRGADILNTVPKRIDIKFLERFPEFVNFRTRKTPSGQLLRNSR